MLDRGWGLGFRLMGFLFGGGFFKDYWGFVSVVLGLIF